MRTLKCINCGTEVSGRTGQKFCSVKCARAGKHNPQWKGDTATYTALHQWVARHLGRPKFCAQCGTIEAKQYVWANLSGQYRRELEDWLRLCQKCHLNFDDNQRDHRGRRNPKISKALYAYWQRKKETV